MDWDYDLVIIGSGPAGEKAAVKAATFDKRVAVVERDWALGGACAHSGLPSKVLRDAVLSYTGARRRLGDLCQGPGEGETCSPAPRAISQNEHVDGCLTTSNTPEGIHSP